MAPNNALGRPTAAAMRARAEQASASPSAVRGRSPGRRTKAEREELVAASDGFGAGKEGQSSVLRYRIHPTSAYTVGPVPWKGVLLDPLEQDIKMLKLQARFCFELSARLVMFVSSPAAQR